MHHGPGSAALMVKTELPDEDGSAASSSSKKAKTRLLDEYGSAASSSSKKAKTELLDEDDSSAALQDCTSDPYLDESSDSDYLESLLAAKGEQLDHGPRLLPTSKALPKPAASACTPPSWLGKSRKDMTPTEWRHFRRNRSKHFWQNSGLAEVMQPAVSNSAKRRARADRADKRAKWLKDEANAGKAMPAELAPL